MRLLPLAAVGLLLGACTTVQSPQESNTAQPAPVVATVTVPTELISIHPAFVTAWTGTDPATFRVYFTDDAVVMTPHGQFTGWTDINTKWITPLITNKSNFTVTATNYTRDGDVIVETGNYGYTMMEGGMSHPMKGTYTYRWRQSSDGTWRIVSAELK